MPPLHRLVLLGIQHAALQSVYLLLIVIVVRAGGATQEQTVSAVSFGMIAAAIGTILQTMRYKAVGSGFLASPVFSSIFLGPSLLAANQYGMATVFGMTIFAGVVEILISRLLKRLRLFFPPAISGFIVAIVGIQLGLVGMEHALDIGGNGGAGFINHLIVAGLTLSIIIALSIWGQGIARLMATSIGIVLGFILSIPFGLVTVDALGAAVSGPYLTVPDISFISYDFELPLVPAFLIAGIAAALRTVGVITTSQKINDDDWKRPELTSIKGGMLADGLASVVSGLLGGIGQNTAPSLVGISKASGATSRYIGYAAAVFMAIVAFVPAVGELFIMMPKAVIGAALVVTACYVIIGGIQIMVSRSINTRETFLVGIAMLLGLSKEVHKDFFDNVHRFVQPFTSTSLSLAVTSALIMHLVFRIGIKKTASYEIDETAEPVESVDLMLMRRGSEWGLAEDTLTRASASTQQLLSHLQEAKLISGDLKIDLSYDELDLIVDVTYSGAILTLPNIGVKRRVFLEEESFSYGLADFLTGVFPDHMESSSRGNAVRIKLMFSI